MNKTIKDFFKVGKFYTSTLAGKDGHLKVCKSIQKNTILFFEKVAKTTTVKGVKKTSYVGRETILRIPPDAYTAITRCQVDGDTLSLYETVEGIGKDKTAREQLLMTFERAMQ